jgi:hypothetical protein
MFVPRLLLCVAILAPAKATPAQSSSQLTSAEIESRAQAAARLRAQPHRDLYAVILWSNPTIMLTGERPVQ